RADRRKWFVPPPNFHTVAVLRLPSGDDIGTDFAEACEIVDPQADPQAALCGELPRQAPGNADIAVVVDHGAKNVPGAHGRHRRRIRTCFKMKGYLPSCSARSVRRKIHFAAASNSIGERRRTRLCARRKRNGALARPWSFIGENLLNAAF